MIGLLLKLKIKVGTMSDALFIQQYHDMENIMQSVYGAIDSGIHHDYRTGIGKKKRKEKKRKNRQVKQSRRANR